MHGLQLPKPQLHFLDMDAWKLHHKISNEKQPDYMHLLINELQLLWARHRLY